MAVRAVSWERTESAPLPDVAGAADFGGPSLLPATLAYDLRKPHTVHATLLWFVDLQCAHCHVRLPAGGDHDPRCDDPCPCPFPHCTQDMPHKDVFKDAADNAGRVLKNPPRTSKHGGSNRYS